MKFLILGALFLFANHTDAQVYKYRCYEYKTFYDDASKDAAKWDSSNALIVLDQKKMKVKTFGMRKQDIDLIRLDTVIRSDDGNHFHYTGVNEVGDECHIDILSYSLSFDNGQAILMEFKDYSVILRLRKND